MIQASVYSMYACRYILIKSQINDKKKGVLAPIFRLDQIMAKKQKTKNDEIAKLPYGLSLKDAQKNTLATKKAPKIKNRKS
jgi:hypothetical protein